MTLTTSIALTRGPQGLGSSKKGCYGVLFVSVAPWRDGARHVSFRCLGAGGARCICLESGSCPPRRASLGRRRGALRVSEGPVRRRGSLVRHGRVLDDPVGGH